MKKYLIVIPAAVMMIGASIVPGFSEGQSSEFERLKEMRRAEYFMMKHMVDSNMSYMKSQLEVMDKLSKMLQSRIASCEHNQRDGARC
jgi:hypothetical protein